MAPYEGILGFCSQNMFQIVFVHILAIVMLLPPHIHKTKKEAAICALNIMLVPESVIK